MVPLALWQEIMNTYPSIETFLANMTTQPIAFLVIFLVFLVYIALAFVLTFV